jgi:hypothetical protein
MGAAIAQSCDVTSALRAMIILVDYTIILQHCDQYLGRHATCLQKVIKGGKTSLFFNFKPKSVKNRFSDSGGGQLLPLPHDTVV